MAAIQDWCRQRGAKTSFIDPGSPWQNPYVESFNSRARDELIAREIFDSIWKPRFSMPTGAMPTMSTVRTALSATNHQRPSPRPTVSRNSY